MEVCKKKSSALEVAEDADVSELLPVSVGVQGEEEGPLECEEAPDAGQVEAAGVRGGLFLSDGEREEGDEAGDRQHRENHADSDEELQTFEPRAPEILQVHDVCDETPERQDT